MEKRKEEDIWKRLDSLEERKDKGKEVEINRGTDAFWDLWKDRKTVSPVATMLRQTVRKGVPFRRR